MTELKLLQGGTVHRSRHEGDVVSEGSRGGYPRDPDAIRRYSEMYWSVPLTIVSGSVNPSQRKA